MVGGRTAVLVLSTCILLGIYARHGEATRSSPDGISAQVAVNAGSSTICLFRQGSTDRAAVAQGSSLEEPIENRA